MAAPTYSTDLTDIITDPASSTGWSLISSGGGGANSFTVPETDDYIQSGNVGTVGCISRNPWSSSIRGMVYNSSQTITSGHAVFIWTKSDVAQALDTKASGGIQALSGSGTGALNCYYVSGSDDAFGGWKCYPIDPNTSNVTPSTTVGSPTTTTSYFGVRWNVPSSGPSKGYPFKIDAVRWGSRVLSVNGDVGNGYATFLGMATFGGNIARRWGLFFLKDGSYFQQGKFLMGQTGGSSVDFRDSNRGIFVQNTEFVQSTFNTFEVQHASSNILWTNISITGLGTVSKGRFLVTDNATVALNGCTFTDMDTFTFLSNSTIQDTTFRRCGLITLGGGTLTNNIIANSTSSASLLAAGLSNVTNNSFTSDGSNHAVQLSSIGAGSMTWDNSTTGYAAGSTGSPVTPTSTGNETIYVNVGSGTLTINVAAGATVPSIRSAGATVNVVAGQVDFTFTVSPSITAYEWRIYSVTALGSLVGASELAGEELATQDNQTYSYTYSSPQPIAVQIIGKANDTVESITYYTLGATDQDVSIILTPDNNN